MPNIREISVYAGVPAFLMCAFVALATPARADIIEVEGATSCPGSLGGGLCNGSVPWQLSALIVSLEAPGAIGNGTQKYVVTNDIGNSFKFTLESTGQNNTGIANNGQCQINGGAMSIFSTCTITDNTGQKTSVGGPQINNMVFPITITFGGQAALGATFDLGFVSMQGTSNAGAGGATPGGGPVPEPASAVLLGTAVIGLVLRASRRTAGAN